MTDKHIDRLLAAKKMSPSAANRTRMRQKAGNLFDTWLADNMNSSVIEPGAGERALMSGYQKAGTLSGAAFRLGLMYKSFPVSVMNKSIMREMYKIGDAKGIAKLTNSGTMRSIGLIASMTMGGYVSMSIRDALDGRKPRSWTNDDGTMNYKTFWQALARGGGLGIYGDVLQNAYNRPYENPALPMIGGPVISNLGDVAGTMMMAAQGMDVRKRTRKALSRNTPFMNLFYIKPVLDYLILWNVQEAWEPGSAMETENAVMRNNGQEYFDLPLVGSMEPSRLAAKKPFTIGEQ